ncbi:dehydrogenase/reductase [Mycobacterium tuberculosis]|nr:dehydrogenase/reductase [Mycobacterium tuberculosis]
MNTGTAVITGASSGLGLQCARALLRRDASWHVVLAVRDPARGRAAMEELGEPNRCSVLEVDLASVRSVRSFVETVRTTPLPPIRALVCNAGLQVVSGIAFTDDGVEMTFGVNHLGHFALVTGILDWLARPARIVVVSSGTHDPSKHTGMPDPRYTCPPTSRTRPPIRTRRPKAAVDTPRPSCATCSSPTSSTAASITENRA